MKIKNYFTLQAIVFFLLCSYTINAQLYINEFMASNDSDISDELGEFEDWIEIYNAGSSSVNLAGYYISDNIAEPTLWQISSDNASLTTVPAGGHLILWADKDIDDGANHINIKLSGDGEDIVLVSPNGSTIIDQYTYETQVTDVSFGRIGDGGSSWDFFGQTTPGASNNTPSGAPQVATPVASAIGGLYSGSVQVSLSTTTSGAQIYYTTDGSVPTEASSLYTGALSYSTNTPLRAKAFLDPLLPSETQTETYLFNINHTFPVVAYTADPVEMFDPDIGMYPNFTEDIEINVNAEMYEPDGTQGFNLVVETEINGTGSAVAAQKSVALKAKGSLGSSTIDHQVFPLSSRDEYRSLILRNSGQDNNITMFRDAMATSLFWDLSDLNGNRPTIKDAEIYGQAYRPGITYINGEYWGILNIRERTDKRYIKVHFGLDDNEIDYIENENEAKEGDLIAWQEFKGFVENNSLVSESNFQYVDDRLDMSHYIDYLAFNIYIDNSDWPGNNIRIFKERAPDTQWRFLTYDLDFSFGLFVAGEPWNSGNNEANSLSRLLTLNGFNWPNPDYSTLLFRRLIENEGWKTRFVNRMADQLNLMYNDARVINRIDAFELEYSPEIDQHANRWSGGFFPWTQNVEILRNFANGRADNVRDHFVQEISGITGVSDLTINLNSASQGEVELSTISVHEDNAPFTGKYFRGIDIPVTAFPNRGYVLNSWSGGLSGSAPFESININSNTTITANFGLGSTSTGPIVINEINYNSSDAVDPGDWIELYNPNSSTVDISGWYFEDESGRFFGIPANTTIAPGGYLVLAETAEKFSMIYPQVSNYIGDFGSDPRGFGLSGGGELITIKNANGVLIDAVDYDDKSPWPESPDGDGPTLQLTNPGLDNALPSSWTGIPATPGALNGTNQGQNQIITFASIPNQFTTAPPFSINATASSGLPVNFTLISGPATLSGNTITLNGTTGTVTIQANQGGDSDWNPAPSVNQSFTVTNPPTGGDYCESKGDAPWEEWIAQVQLNDLDNESGKTQYSDYTDMSASLNSGENYTITLSTGFSYETADEYFRVWIDYDQDGVFQEPSEIAYSGIVSGFPNGSPTGSISGNINVPSNATIGDTRMRVAMQKNAYAGPCENFPIGEVEDYTITIGTGNGSSINLSCTDDITITAATGTNGATLNWSNPIANTSCPGGGLNVTQTGGAPNGSFFPVGSYQIVYSADDNCGNEASCSFNITVLSEPVGGDYCESKGDAPWEEWIAQVQLNDLDNESAKSQYSDFTNLSTSLNTNGNYTITLTTGFSYYTADEYFRVWIDYDQDGLFEEPSEIAYSGIVSGFPDGSPTGSISGNINVPSNATIGSTRMRVSMQQNSYADPCESFPIGEVEDYTVIIGSGNGSSINLNCTDDLTVTAAAGANGATINWSNPIASTSCPDGGLTVTQTGGAPNGSFFPVGNYQIAYNADDNCGNEASCTFNVTVLAEPIGGYCESSSDFPWHEWISNVQLAEINNPSAKSLYSDFTNISTALNASQTYDLILSASFSWQTYDEYCNVWIDYNQNQQFESSELVYTGAISAPPIGVTTILFNGLVTVPPDALNGQTRMRVSLSRENISDPCAVLDQGEVEDYTVNISNTFSGGGGTSGYVQALSDIEIFPNPTSDDLTIILRDQMELKNLEIFNITGQSVFQKDGTEDEIVYYLNVSQWKEGIYFIHFNLNNGKRISKRFVVNANY